MASGPRRSRALRTGAADIPAALEKWERTERAITDHTQRVSVALGWPATWPPKLRALALSGEFGEQTHVGVLALVALSGLVSF